MTPTYSKCEIILLLINTNFDLQEMEILGELIAEEVERYTLDDLDIIYQTFRIKVRSMQREAALEVLDRIWKVGK